MQTSSVLPLNTVELYFEGRNDLALPLDWVRSIWRL